MSDQERLYARDVYGQTLVELGKEDPNIVVCDADLSGSTRTALFARQFPERFFNFGVAEQNMMATAAGMASCGKIVFASTFAMFATARPLDQIRNSICYNKLNVKIVATHGGITVGEDGASHQALEDIAFLRSIPNIKIVVPADGPQTRQTIRAAAKTPGPFYIRLGRAKVSTLDSSKEFALGKGEILKTGGKECAVIACGVMVTEVLKAHGILQQKNIDTTVVNIHTVKPLDEQLVLELAQKYKTLIVCEEHQSSGGLYSAVCEFLCRTYPTNVFSIGVNDRFGQSGAPQELMEKYGLSGDAIARKVEEFLRD